ncbi:hypothetical protein CJF30_00003772 [Rutstroemia sp. NJR-2017a BBW]|nr:hypothetical protein CJF30_00003772 [Rutstroemia sp. NJR-2017a BBW]
MATNNFGANTTALEVAQAFKDQIRGKNVLITGTNPRGLGAATARAIASESPALLILTYRTKEKADQVVAELSAAYPDVKIETLHLDLASTASVRAAAKELSSKISHLDILINNAGVMSVQDLTLTKEGVEMHFATNHVGHFLFTNLIMGKIIAASKKAQPGSTRIVMLSGGWHQFSPVRFDDLNFEGKPIPEDQQPDKAYLAKFGHPTDNSYIPEVAYAQSKTANILFATYLTEHLYKKHGILSFAVNPGGILTEIARFLPQSTLDRLVGMDIVDKTEETGTSTTMAAAFDPNLKAESSRYLHDCNPTPPAPYADDQELAEKLWKISEEIVGEKFALDF